MPSRRTIRPTVRQWHTAVVGLVGPDDVSALQSKVRAYHEQLLVALDNLNTAWATGPQKTGAPLPTTGKFTAATWDDLSSRVATFVAESSNELNPMAYLYAGSAYDRGRGLVTELDTWRDELASLGASGVPVAMPVPASDLGITGGIGMLALAVLAFMFMRE